MNLKTELLLKDLTERMRHGIYEIIDQSQRSFYINTLEVICDIKKSVNKDLSDHDKLAEIDNRIKKYEECINKHSSYLT